MAQVKTLRVGYDEAEHQRRKYMKQLDVLFAPRFARMQKSAATRAANKAAKAAKKKP